MMNNICTQYQLRTEPCDAEARKYLKTFILWSLMLKNIEIDIQKNTSASSSPLRLSVPCIIFYWGVAGSSLIKCQDTGQAQASDHRTHPIIDNKIIFTPTWASCWAQVWGSQVNCTWPMNVTNLFVWPRNNAPLSQITRHTVSRVMPIPVMWEEAAWHQKRLGGVRRLN